MIKQLDLIGFWVEKMIFYVELMVFELLQILPQLDQYVRICHKFNSNWKEENTD